MIPEKVKEKLRNWRPGFHPMAFKALLIAVPAAALAVPLILVAIPFLEIFNDMAVQPKAKTQGVYGRLYGEPLPVERLPVPHTLPMDHIPYEFPGQDEATVRKAEQALKNPVKPTMENLKRGQKLFNTYCFPCHGKFGEGNGPIVGPDLFPAPPSLHTDAAKKFSDGRIFHAITSGQNKMPPYADKLEPAERWDAVHYVRVLQRAFDPKPEDLDK